jgi:hypothetical protein
MSDNPAHGHGPAKTPLSAELKKLLTEDKTRTEEAFAQAHKDIEKRMVKIGATSIALGGLAAGASVATMGAALPSFAVPYLAMTSGGASELIKAKKLKKDQEEYEKKFKTFEESIKHEPAEKQKEMVNKFLNNTENVALDVAPSAPAPAPAAAPSTETMNAAHLARRERVAAAATAPATVLPTHHLHRAFPRNSESVAAVLNREEEETKNMFAAMNIRR